MMESQKYTASVHDTDPDERSEYDMKNESVVEKRHDMTWKVSWECSDNISICDCTLYGYTDSCTYDTA